MSEAFAHEPFTLPVALFGLDECRKLRTGPLDFMRRVMGPMLLLRFFALPATLLLAGAPLYWAAQHRLHHAHCESDLDPHSPTASFYVFSNSELERICF